MPRILAFFYALEITGIAVGLGLALPGITYDNVCVVKGVPGTLIIYGQVDLPNRKFHVLIRPESSYNVIYQGGICFISVHTFRSDPPQIHTSREVWMG